MRLISPEEAKEFGFAIKEEDLRYKEGEFKEPKHYGFGYKIFYYKDNKLYPPVIANHNGVYTPLNIWIPCSCPEIIGYTKKDHRPKVMSGGNGTRGRSLGPLAFRPGWHLGEVPYAEQFLKKKKINGKSVWPEELVWAECCYSNDIDYQEEAMQYGYTKSGKFNHAYAGLPRIPKNGSYRYRTNPNPNTLTWIISGGIKVNRILSFDEVDEILKSNNIEPPLVMSEKDYKRCIK